MTAPHYRYLNSDVHPRLTSVLADKIRDLQPRAPASQWISTLRGLTQKGVKQREIEEAGVLEWLASQGNHPIGRDALLNKLALRPTIKEIDLRAAHFRSYVVPGYDEYQETLYCLNSPRNNIEDRLDEIRYELEDLDFNHERLIQDPQLVFQLDHERRALLASRESVPDFDHHHFSGVIDPTTGTKIKNLLAHARTSRRDDLFFIDEIQSDWAQRRRLSGPSGRIPDGPFIKHTDSWAGLVIRRLMQRAADDPRIQGVAWINASLRNGGRVGANIDDGLDDFYLGVLPTLANKALKGTGVSVRAADVQFKNGAIHSLPYFPMTTEVRAKLQAAQPMYSLDLLPRSTLALGQDMSHSEMIREAREMLGSTVSVRLVGKIIRAANGEEEEAAARQLSNLIEISTRTRSAARAFSHEAFHYASKQLMSAHEAASIRDAFEDGSPLNSRVRTAMVAARMSPQAISQCSDADEAAAHAFSLWREQRFHFDERAHEFEGRTGLDKTVGRLFKKIENAFQALGQWARRVVGEAPRNQSARISERLFEALRDGTLQRRRAQTEIHADVRSATFDKVIAQTSKSAREDRTRPR
ncbi:hypothetical protein [Achromobacter sp. DH1f]|uniref:hypothetical protein n=1 Tax=Achromobacter sp. DH1f TaxID=1397275 RepID=UPI0004688C78|nr:hypothetical protein [Achromobacter sp. DH1f]